MLIRTDNDRRLFISKANDIDLTKKPWVFTAEVYKKNRSNEQNAILNSWYQEIDKSTSEGFAYIRGFYKWTFGCPIILARGEPEFNALIKAIVESMQYEEIINLFGKSTIAISSIMKVDELSQYLKCIEQDCFTRHIPLARNDDYEYAVNGR